MAELSVANLNALLDEVGKAYLRTLGTSASANGVGEPTDGSYGAAGAISTARSNVATIADADVAADILPGLNIAKTNLSAKKLFAPSLRAIKSRLDLHARTWGGSNYSSLLARLTYLNVTHATKWQALQDGRWRAAWVEAFGSNSTPENWYFEVLQGSVYTNGLRKSVVTGAGTDTETAGATIDSTLYCGGFPYIVVSGLTGSGVVTVTGTEYNPATKVATAGKTWTYTVSGNGTFALAVGTAATDSLIVACSAVAVAAGISAGTIYVEAHRPSGRSLLA